MKHNSTIKKILTPIIYFLFYIPSFIFTIMVLGAYEKIFGLHSFFGRIGDLEGLVILVLVITVVMCLGNYLIQKIDPLKKAIITDHFRLSALYYLSLICIGIHQIISYSKYPIINCQSDCLVYAINILFLAIPLFAIIINGCYLYKKTT